MSHEISPEVSTYDQKDATTGEDKVWWTEALVEAQLSYPWFEPEDSGTPGLLIEEIRDRYGVVPSEDAFWWIEERAQAIATYDEDWTADPDEKEFLAARQAAMQSGMEVIE